MVSGDMFDGMFTTIFVLGIILVAVFWGGWEFIDWMWIEDGIKSTEPILYPSEMRLIARDSVIDTIYIYR